MGGYGDDFSLYFPRLLSSLSLSKPLFFFAPESKTRLVISVLAGCDFHLGGGDQ
jgi:hypothetical protein